MQKAFGVGAHWSVAATAPLVDGASQIIAACAEPVFAAKATAAGVGPTQIAQITAARDAVVGADRQQNVARGSLVAATTTKDSLLQELKGEVAFLRKVAKSVFADDSTTLATFRSVVSRHTPAPRKAPAAGAAPRKKPRGTSRATKRIKLAVAAARPAGAPTPVAKKKAAASAPATKKSVKKGAKKKAR